MNQKLTVTLLLKGRGGLVVGGGKVGSRKVRSLLEQRISPLTVVSPEACEEVQTLAEAGTIHLISRHFSASDCDGMAFVIAATPFQQVNAAVIQAAKSYGIPVGSVDELWNEGDFISPATVESEGVSVSVSTGGVSCRRSRMVKDWVARHLDRMRGSELFIIGTDHQLLPLFRREPYHLNGKRYQEAGGMISLLSSVHEFMLFNTCNRVELIGVGAPDFLTEQALVKLMGFETLDKGSFYVKKGVEAFRHFAVVTAGLLSQTPGENHITAQVKEACEVSCRAGWAGKTIREWVSTEIHLSRQIRAAVSPLLKTTEIETLCKLYIDRELAGVEGKKVLIVGTGNVGESLLREFKEEDCRIVWAYHRQIPVILESRASIRLIQLNNLKDELSDIDILIMAVNSDHPILHSGHAAFLDPDKEFCAIDLSIPRNISPDLVKMTPQMQTIDLDDLKHWYRREACDMTRIMQVAADVLDAHADLYEKWSGSVRGNNPD